MKLVKALVAFTLKIWGFQPMAQSQFSQELVKENSEGLERVGDEGFEPSTNRLRVYSSQ
ncbi:MAG: hypothetical protein V7L26_03175 [Nostoc sp.]|uniref:hypothetical protein n=1 Tax=Nostoc sp. TaxID=1180 RepID=UPI002FF34983